MRIRTKLIVSLAVPLITIMVLFGYLTRLRSRDLVSSEITREGRAVARITQSAMEDYLRDHQLDDARELVDQITGFERIFGAQLFDASGTLIYQSASLGTAPIVPPHALEHALRERRAVETQWMVGREPVVSFILPLSSPTGELVGAVQVLQLASFIEEASRDSRNSIATLTAIMILGTGIAILLVTRFSFDRPVADLTARIRLLGGGDLSARVPVRAQDEVGRLAAEFNRMCERLEASQRSLLAEHETRRRVERSLRDAERLASVGQLAAGLAHEIGTALNVIGGRADALLRRLRGNDAAEKNLRIITSQIERISRIVRGMLDFARAREPRLAPTDAAAVVRRVLELLEHQLRERGVAAEVVAADDLPPAWADADQLHQVVLNLAANALDAMPRGGTLRVRVGPAADVPAERKAAGRAYVRLAFEDSGTGIAPEHLSRIFDPFFTTKEVGRGTGLGLSVSYGIVQEHDGWIDVESEPGRGTCLKVHLPVAEARARGAAAAHAAILAAPHPAGGAS